MNSKTDLESKEDKFLKDDDTIIPLSKINSDDEHDENLSKNIQNTESPEEIINVESKVKTSDTEENILSHKSTIKNIGEQKLQETPRLDAETNYIAEATHGITNSGSKNAVVQNIKLITDSKIHSQGTPEEEKTGRISEQKSENLSEKGNHSTVVSLLSSEKREEAELIQEFAVSPKSQEQLLSARSQQSHKSRSSTKSHRSQKSRYSPRPRSHRKKNRKNDIDFNYQSLEHSESRKNGSIFGPSLWEQKYNEESMLWEKKEIEFSDKIKHLSDDINKKQILVDRLVDEVDKRSDAIRNCGAEIVKLRKENQRLEGEKQNLANRLALREREIQIQVDNLIESKNSADIPYDDDIHELRQRYSILKTQYNSERDRNRKLMERLGELQNKAKQRRVDIKKVKNLEAAHQAQAKYIQRLQDDLSKIGVYKTTIKTQEKVIAKLENLMEAKLRSKSDYNNPSDETVQRLRDEITRLQNRNEELENKFVNREHFDKGMQNKIKELENGLNDAESTSDQMVEALEKQLVENAKVFAKKLADLKMKLLEYEAAESDSENGSDVSTDYGSDSD